MSTIDPNFTTRSGWKTVRNRRISASPTPYDRPPRSPNWLSSARKIAEDAGRVMRSVLWSNSSSSSGDGASSSDDEVSSGGCCADLSSLDTNEKNERLNEDARGLYPGLMEWRSATKRAIVMLLMQETFTREECECLIDIINSRNVETSNSENVQEKRPSRAVRRDACSTDVCCIAVMEARKWINERKLRSDSKSASPSSVTSCNYSYSSSPYKTTKIGSPVEIARSYMRGRPPSPMDSVAAYKTPQSRRIQSLWERSPGPIKGKSLSCSEDLGAAIARGDAEGSQSKVFEPSQYADVLKRATPVILTRRSLTMELDSQTESKLSEPNSVGNGHDRVITSMINTNEVDLCKFASESSVEIPVNEICL